METTLQMVYERDEQAVAALENCTARGGREARIRTIVSITSHV
jgi:hypothetical protein